MRKATIIDKNTKYLFLEYGDKIYRTWYYHGEFKNLRIGDVLEKATPQSYDWFVWEVNDSRLTEMCRVEDGSGTSKKRCFFYVSAVIQKYEKRGLIYFS